MSVAATLFASARAARAEEPTPSPPEEPPSPPEAPSLPPEAPSPPPEAPSPPPEAPESRQKEAPPSSRVYWSPDWPRFRLSEYIGTVVLGAASIYLHYFAPLPSQAKWQGDNAFDDSIRNWLVLDTPEARARAARVSDVLWLGGTAVPFVVDLPVALFVHRDRDLTWQLLLMDLEANAVAGFINNGLFFVAGRGRPSHKSCEEDPSYDPLCGSTGNNASFPSGHTLGVATAAGLMCVHHRYIPLYGNAVADGGVCALMTVATVATAVTRIMADRHYASDALIGGAIGFGSGYGLPWLLHYRYGPRLVDREEGGVKATVIPLLSPHAAGVGLVGLL
jgi:membrane-associated phospholipid phosphatase